ncbi:glycosyl transferase family 36 [Lysobacter sp. H21R4]|uniref:GH36-type glycosyl hydrolase domain-containing protein n=1 Tax=Lysobacter sp. H21R4 TaxID=2781021 RepID=UPI00188845E3|nr:glycosyl transferase family 36 [Lysobacter sp. H21R4]QOY61664.1 glycosyl transferase family 36 [Lysobacter sp. H21R4]
MSVSNVATIAVQRAHLLSNGRYTTLLTDAGSGWSRWCGRALTRWREDPTRDVWGSYLLLRDVDGGALWSPTRQPMPHVPGDIDIDAGCGVFSSRRIAQLLETHLIVVVAADRDAELRHLTITNRDLRPRVLEVTSYSEPVLGSLTADAAHPAFSKLFVRTEWVAEGGVLLATRRRQSPEEHETWVAQVARVEGQPSDTCEYETDRRRFLGRGRPLQGACQLRNGEVLGENAGDVLDAVISLRRRVRVAPGATVRIAFWNCVADSRENVLALARSLASAEHCGAVIEQARAAAAARRTQFELDETCAARYSQLLAALMVSNPAWRASRDAIASAVGGAPQLWAGGISGDRPIVLVIADEHPTATATSELLRVQRYWQSMGLGVDVVVLGHRNAVGGAAPGQSLARLVEAQKRALGADPEAAKAEAFFVDVDQIDPGLRDGLIGAARVILPAGEWPPSTEVGGDFPGSTTRAGRVETAAQDAPARTVSAAASPHAGPGDDLALQFDNGYGGFSPGGDEYVIRTDGYRCTPAPWSNVVANPVAGFIATGEGGGHTFSCNSQQNPLTPWPNDPVTDEPCEVVYLSDRDSGALWSATPLPLPGPGTKRITRHGRGWSSWSHQCDGLEIELLQLLSPDDGVKVSRLRIRNRSGRARAIVVTAYLQWALGRNGSVPGPQVVTSQDPQTSAVFAVNRWRADFAGRVAFADIGEGMRCFTCDRGEFLGMHGSLERPASLHGALPLSNWCGAGRDPCAALQSLLEIEPDATGELRFLIGDAESTDAASALVQHARGLDLDAVMDAIRNRWDDVTATLQVDTPDPAMNLLLNQWLLYQVLSCRMWARTAYYQASGAYGFRDQLQDVMALCIACPEVAREHLLRAASRQFLEGDVQHWWLPPSGKGIRTRMSDDRLWLPYSALHYVTVTGDAQLLDAHAAFLEGPTLEEGQTDDFFTPTVSATTASIYEHCARAVDASLALGPHRLPLMGTGDWNDGMNRVGAQGSGESVWLGWFLLDVIARLGPIARSRGDHQRADCWDRTAATVKSAMEGAGWDGAWYRRGYYDDGTPLGSAQQPECRIDSIAQSWAVMSAAGDPDRRRQAMESTERELVDHQHRLARLLTPPFENGPHDPGYIKAYPPGVRENGGQYTHGCIWSIFAWAGLGEGGRAWELFDYFNPITHSNSPPAAEHFVVEPYVSCADVYSVGALAGRGGWTWYTGSAAWLYRAGVEALLGFHLRGDHLLLDPCIPANWPGFSILYRHGASRYRIQVDNPEGATRGIRDATLDGAPIRWTGPAARIPLRDDGQEHRLHLTMGVHAADG